MYIECLWVIQCITGNCLFPAYIIMSIDCVCLVQCVTGSYPLPPVRLACIKGSRLMPRRSVYKRESSVPVYNGVSTFVLYWIKDYSISRLHYSWLNFILATNLINGILIPYSDKLPTFVDESIVYRQGKTFI